MYFCYWGCALSFYSYQKRAVRKCCCSLLHTLLWSGKAGKGPHQKLLQFPILKHLSSCHLQTPFVGWKGTFGDASPSSAARLQGQMQHGFPAELSDGGQGSRNPLGSACQAGQEMLPEGLDPSLGFPGPRHGYFPLLSIPLCPARTLQKCKPLHFSSLSLIHQSFGVYV